MVRKNKQKKGILKLVCLLLGLIAGVCLFSLYRYQWIYKINSQYLTFAQPEMMQSLAKLFQFKPKKGVTQFIVFGGSASLHAINDIDLSDKLTKKYNRPIQVILVGNDDQSLLDTYELISVLPDVSPKYHVNIINTWSFWRLIPGAVSKIIDHSYQNKIFFSKAGSDVAPFLAKNNFELPANYSNWKDYFAEEHDSHLSDSLSKWVKYFLLDKLIKLNRGRYSYLFKDPLSDDPSEMQSPYYERRTIKLMQTRKRQLIRDAIIKKLFASYSGQSNALTPEKRKQWIMYSMHMFSAINELGRKKGYNVITLELPINAISMKNKAIRHNLEVIHSGIAALKIPYVTAHNQTYLENDSNAWWDLVHMNLVGKQLYESTLIKLFGDVIRKGEA